MSTAARVILPELLDHAPAHEAIPSLDDLTRINKYLGGYSTLRSILTRVVAPADSFSLLDVGAASGDMAARIRHWYPRARITAFDYKANHLAGARCARIVGNAFQLPFTASSFDFVFCSLFFHHFQNEAVIELLASFGRTARRAVIAIDLERGPLAFHFIPATRWLFHWDPITVHDAPISVAAGFKANELLELAVSAGFKHPATRVHRPWGRLSLIAPVSRSEALS